MSAIWKQKPLSLHYEERLRDPLGRREVRRGHRQVLGETGLPGAVDHLYEHVRPVHLDDRGDHVAGVDLQGLDVDRVGRHELVPDVVARLPRLAAVGRGSGLLELLRGLAVPAETDPDRDRGRAPGRAKCLRLHPLAGDVGVGHVRARRRRGRSRACRDVPGPVGADVGLRCEGRPGVHDADRPAAATEDDGQGDRGNRERDDGKPRSHRGSLRDDGRSCVIRYDLVKGTRIRRERQSEPCLVPTIVSRL